MSDIQDATWFTKLPDWFKLGDPIRVIKEGPERGRIAGTFWTEGQKHLAASIVCEDLLNCSIRDFYEATPSPTGYQMFNVKKWVDPNGNEVWGGPMGMAGHAPLSSSLDQVQRIYDKPGGRGFIRAFDMQDENGKWHGVVLGQAITDATDRELDEINVSSLSGHWMPNSNHNLEIDCAGPCLVSRPGILPIAASNTIADGYVIINVKEDSNMSEGTHKCDGSCRKVTAAIDEAVVEDVMVVETVKEDDTSGDKALDDYKEETNKRISDLEATVDELYNYIIDNDLSNLDMPEDNIITEEQFV